MVRPTRSGRSLLFVKGGLIMKVAAMVLVLVFLTAPMALAMEYPPGETYGQIPPDRVETIRASAEAAAPATVAIYSPEGRFGFYQVAEQYSPERVLAERFRAVRASEEYMAFSPSGRYPVWGCCEQVSPDRVLCERCGTS
jgi:hypothetical protein